MNLRTSCEREALRGVAVVLLWLPALTVCTLGAIAAARLGVLEGTEEP